MPEVIKMTAPKNITGINLHYYRTQARLSYAALSRLLRENGFIISPRRLKRIEDQVCKVYAKDLLALSRVFHTSSDSLIADDPPQPNPGGVTK